MTKVFDIIVVGSGAAGLSAAIYAGRYLMKVLVVEGEFGGETATAGTIWNYPGVKAADGFELMATMKEQAKDVGVEIMFGKVADIKSDSGCFAVCVNDKEFFAKTIL